MASYKDYVRQLTIQNPSLASLSRFLDSSAPSESELSKIDIIRVDDEGLTQQKGGFDIEKMTREITALQHQQARRRDGLVIIIEDPGAVEMETLGELLDVNPFFFCGHVASTYEKFEAGPLSPLMALPPSRLCTQEYINIHFQRVIDFGHESAVDPPFYKVATENIVPRNVRLLSPLSGRRLGLARSCCSVLSKACDNGSWICVILVDPGPDNLFRARENTGQRKKHSHGIPTVARAIHREIPGKMASFSSCRDRRAAWAGENMSPRQCLLELFRVKPPGLDESCPSILPLSYYPLQMAISEWMVYWQLMSRYVKLYEYSFQTVPSLIKRFEDQDMLDLQRWQRRALQSQQKLRITIGFVEYWRTRSQPDRYEEWDSLVSDLQYVQAQIQQCARSLEMLHPIITSLVQLMDSRKSLSEAAYVKRLTYLAMVFIPLTFVTGLFSMASDYAPGSNQFWVYWAISLPVTLTVLALAIIPLDGFNSQAAIDNLKARVSKSTREQQEVV
ncbi:hypothetical protein F4780DRAFT_395409 [Xylariomycetidae sp. FL0641]|nr:hypothetical protein F4780DRAFT_395409 [Xylariomycetidae sp. FL0641]